MPMCLEIVLYCRGGLEGDEDNTHAGQPVGQSPGQSLACWPEQSKALRKPNEDLTSQALSLSGSSTQQFSTDTD